MRLQTQRRQRGRDDRRQDPKVEGQGWERIHFLSRDCYTWPLQEESWDDDPICYENERNFLCRGLKYWERISSGFRGEEDILTARKLGGIKYCYDCSIVFTKESAEMSHKGHETSDALKPQALLCPTSTVLSQVWFSEMCRSQF